MRVVVIGSGVAGLACTHLHEGYHDIVLHAKDDRVGGHAHTQVLAPVAVAPAAGAASMGAVAAGPRSDLADPSGGDLVGAGALSRAGIDDRDARSGLGGDEWTA